MNRRQEKLKKQLGIDPGTAAHRLRKLLLFYFVQKSQLDTCYHCHAKIESIDEFSIEHITPWLDSTNPVALFFDLNNIAYSHTRCNTGNARHNTPDCLIADRTRGLRRRKRLNAPAGFQWCSTGQHYVATAAFTRNSSKKTGFESECKQCRAQRRSNLEIK